MSGELNYENPRFKSMGFEFVDEKIGIRKNFLSKEYMKELINILSNFSESDWRSHGNYEVGDLGEEDFITDKVSPPINIMPFLNGAILDIVTPEYWTIDHLFLSRLSAGQKPGLQTVNRILQNGEKEFYIDYVATTPIGDWEGGEYFFPKKNITVSLDPGDLMIFGADEEYQIDVQEITKGIRYTSFVPIIKHPIWMVL